MRPKGSKNTKPAKTGQPRRRCCKCGRRYYRADLVPAGIRGHTEMMACKNGCKSVYDKLLIDPWKD